jgi:hypothetical protein
MQKAARLMAANAHGLHDLIRTVFGWTDSPGLQREFAPI